MTLLIDTTGDDRALVSLRGERGTKEKSVSVRVNERIGNNFFAALTRILRGRHPLRIGVVTGPGRFSRVRHGVAIANALGFAWQIPVFTVSSPSTAMNGKKRFHPVLPFYDKEPNITKPAKRAGS